MITFPKYEAYQESGVAWLNEVPSHWEIKRFKFLYTRSNAGEVIDKSHWHEGEELLFTCQRTPMSSSFSNFSETLRTKQNDLLLTRNGTPYVHIPPVGAIYSNVVQRVQLIANTNRKFIWFALSNSCLNLRGYGDIIESFNMSTWNELLVSLPSVEEQNRIVKFLDRKTAEIDEAIAHKQRLIELLQEQKAILINQAVTKGLNLNAQITESGVDWLGSMPKHWELRRLKHLFVEVDDRSTDGSETLLSLRMNEGLIPHDEVSDKPIEDSALIGYKRVRPGEMVMNRMRAAIGLFGVATTLGIVSPDYAIFKKSESLEIDYYLRLFKTDALKTVFLLESKGIGTGSQGFLRLYSDRFGMIKVPCPPLEEQQEILKYIQEVEREFSAGISQIINEIKLLQELRSLFIAKAVTGKIKV